MKEWQEIAQRLSNLDDFIEYCEATAESEWLVDLVRSRDNTKNCLFGHLVNWYYGKDYKGVVSPVWDMFEEMWATTFYVYPINDGQNSKYQQKSPKGRCIALLKNLRNGTELNTEQAMEKEMKLINEMGGKK